MTVMSSSSTAFIEHFLSVPSVLKEQVHSLAPFLRDNKSVSEHYRELKDNVGRIHIRPPNGHGKSRKYKDRRSVKRLLLWSCIFEHISAYDVAQPAHLRYLQCYNDKREAVVQLDKIISCHQQMKAFRAHFILEELKRQHPDPVIVKLYQSRRGEYDTSFEIGIYRRLGDPSPSLGIECQLWNIPTLVMMTLNEIGAEDDAYEIGVQILPQLARLHEFTLHSDLKPCNIMKAPRKQQHPAGDAGVEKPGCLPQVKWDYRLIDFGGCARDHLDYGFRRRTWSKKWTCQPCNERQTRSDILSTPKHDLIELGFTLQALRDQSKRHAERQERRNQEKHGAAAGAGAGEKHSVFRNPPHRREERKLAQGRGHGHGHGHGHNHGHAHGEEPMEPFRTVEQIVADWRFSGRIKPFMAYVMAICDPRDGPYKPGRYTKHYAALTAILQGQQSSGSAEEKYHHRAPTGSKPQGAAGGASGTPGVRPIPNPNHSRQPAPAPARSGRNHRHSRRSRRTPTEITTTTTSTSTSTSSSNGSETR